MMDTFHKDCILDEKEINILLHSLFDMMSPLMNKNFPCILAQFLETYFKYCPQI